MKHRPQNLPKFPGEHELTESLKTLHAQHIYDRLFIGEQIKKLRRHAGLTQGSIAKKLKTSQSVVARMENGKQNFTIHTLAAIAFLLGKKITIRFH